MNRNLINILMLLSLVALTWVAVQRPGQTPEVEPAALTRLDPEAIERIELARGETILRLHRREGRWWLAGSPELPADPGQVERLLALAGARAQRSYPAADLDLSVLDLAPPALRLRLNDREILVGGRSPLDELRYVSVDDQVHLIQDPGQDRLDPNPLHWVSRKLLPDGAGILTIRLPAVQLRRAANGHWTLTPARDDLSADSPNQLAQAWNQAQALWVREYQADPGGQPIEIELDDGKLIVFEWRQDAREAVFARPELGLQYHLPSASAAALVALPEAAASATPTDVEPGPAGPP